MIFKPDRRPIGFVGVTPNPAHPRNLWPEWATINHEAATFWLEAKFRAMLRFYRRVYLCTPAGMVNGLDFTGVVAGDPLIAGRIPHLKAMIDRLRADHPDAEFGWHSGWKPGPDPRVVETNTAQKRRTPSLTTNADAEFFRVNHAPLYDAGFSAWSADASSGEKEVKSAVDHAMNAASHGHKMLGEAVPHGEPSSTGVYTPNLTYVKQMAWWGLSAWFHKDEPGEPFKGADPGRLWTFNPATTEVHVVFQAQFTGPAACSPANVASYQRRRFIPGGWEGVPDELHRLMTASVTTDPTGDADA